MKNKLDLEGSKQGKISFEGAKCTDEKKWARRKEQKPTACLTELANAAVVCFSEKQGKKLENDQQKAKGELGRASCACRDVFLQKTR